MPEPRWTRRASFAWVAGAYAAALAAAWVTILLLPDVISPLWSAAIADVVATFVVFAFSRGLACSSVYDAYWSVVPPFIVLYWTFSAEEGIQPIRAGAVIFLVCWWAVRLTWNWAIGWPGLHHQDWRYEKIKEKFPKLWFLSDLFAIHLFPTAQVFLGLTGAWLAVAAGTRGLSWVDALAFIVTAGAIVIETVADRQMRRFAAVKKPGDLMDQGLWAYSRHPNYFGELSFWWGLYLFGVAAAPQVWWTIAGPLAMTAMFMGASIPWMDRRSCERRPEYAEHMKRVSGLIPWFPKSH